MRKASKAGGVEVYVVCVWWREGQRWDKMKPGLCRALVKTLTLTSSYIGIL